MARRIGLGRGLNALLDNADENEVFATPEEVFKHSLETSQEEHLSFSAAAAKKNAGSSKPAEQTDIVQLPVNVLVANPGQPRKNFDESELRELSESIKTFGIIQPIIAARESSEKTDGAYIIIAGERRTRAARLAGLETVPVIIREYTDQKKLEVSLIENIQRTDLNPIEEAAAYKNLMDFSGISQDELAMRMGKKRSTVANALRLLRLPVEIQKSLEAGKLSPGHARALLSVTDTKARDIFYKELLAKEHSVREAEKRAAVLNAEKDNASKKGKTAKGEKNRPPEIDAMVEKFINKLGTKVKIDGGLNSGRILIDYYSMEDLERLYEILG